MQFYVRNFIYLFLKLYFILFQNITLDWNFVVYNIYCIFIYIELILSFFADARNFDHLVVRFSFFSDSF